MPKPHKIEKVEQISQKLKETKVCVFLENQGMSVAQADTFRKSVREAKGEIRVFKNTLLKIALKNVSSVEVDPKILTGATMVGFAYDDAVAVVKAIADFQGEKANTKNLSFKAGIMDEKMLNVEQLVALSKLPGRDVLFSQLLNVMQAPATQLVQVMQAPARDLVRVLKAYQDKLEDNN